MKISELYREGCELLEKAGVDNFKNESRWIFESVFNCGREFLIFNSQSEADASKSGKYLEMINMRSKGMPVQYVIGSWDFYGESFSVGEGVLIPRPETEMLVDFALNYLNDITKPVVYDLCSGSGCIGLSVAKNNPDATVILIEKSSAALEYLNRNVKAFDCKNVKVVCGDVLCGFEMPDLPAPDLILSNPPYIESAEIADLQSEVHYEPAMALDAGDDGLIFYRAIAERWLGHCSAVAVECGEGQEETIKNLFSSVFADVYSVQDFNGIERMVVGRERK